MSRSTATVSLIPKLDPPYFGSLSAKSASHQPDRGRIQDADRRVVSRLRGDDRSADDPARHTAKIARLAEPKTLSA
jgi:hypothetical protein